MRIAVPMLATALLLTATLGAIPSSAFHEDGVPIVVAGTGGAAGSWGIHVTTTGTGTLAADLYTAGPATTGAAGGGICQTDASGAPIFCFIFTALLSPNRLIVVPPTQGAPANVVFEANTAETDATCAFVCTGLTFTDAAPGDYYFVLWGGGGSSSGFEVRTASGAGSSNAGSALVAADSEFTNGNPDIQIQQGVAGVSSVGAKVIQDANVGFAAPARLYGIFFDFDFLKFACLGVCVFPVGDVNNLMGAACGVGTIPCGTSHVTWTGPGGIGNSNKLNFLLGTAAGDYDFRIDSKYDAYGPATCVIVACALILEDFTFLNMGSATVPA